MSSADRRKHFWRFPVLIARIEAMLTPVRSLMVRRPIPRSDNQIRCARTSVTSTKVEGSGMAMP
jgi:hypothetical protein